MKIIDLLKQRNNERDVRISLENVKGFDFTEYEVEEIFEILKPTFLKSENWESYGPVSACDGVFRSTVVVKKLDNGKKYPVLYIDILTSSCGTKNSVILEINPFGCDEARGGCSRCVLKKNISKAFRKFMLENFGKIYVSKNNEFFSTIKENDVEQALLDAKERIKMANKECRENLIDL